MIKTEWPQRPPEPVPELTVRWEGLPRAAADLTRLRRELRAAVGRLPEQDDDGEGLDRLLLVFKELASNGLRHGRPPVRVLLATVPTGWLIDVSDAAADRPPVPARGRDAAAGGMGLPLVARLTAAHGWTVHGERKHVWARIDAVPRPGTSNGGVARPRWGSEPTRGAGPRARRGAPTALGKRADRRDCRRRRPGCGPHPRGPRRPRRRTGLPAGVAGDR